MLNVVALVGRLVADPELKYTPSGTAVCTLRLAVDRRFKSETGERQADFFDVVAWRQSAEFAANYLAKGRLVSVSGRLQQRSWVQQDGQKRYVVEIVADDLQGLDRPREARGGEPAPMPGDGEMPTSASMDTVGDTDMDYDPFDGE